MKQYIKNYLKHYNIGEQDFIECKVCRKQASDIHHIKFRSQGGTDDVSNLIALCRKHHDEAHDKKLTAEELYSLI